MKKYLFLTDYQTGLIVKTEILEAGKFSIEVQKSEGVSGLIIYT